MLPWRNLILIISLVISFTMNISIDSQGSKTTMVPNVLANDLVQENGPPIVVTAEFLNGKTNPRQISFLHSDVLGAAADILELHEGFSAVPYKCSSGKWTIGYGQQIKSQNIKRITKDKARVWLMQELQEIAQDFDREIPWWRSLSPARQQVFLNLAYNVGVDKFYTFDVFLSSVKTQRYTAAANTLIGTKKNRSRYKCQVGSRAEDLATAMRTGNWDLTPMYKKYL